MKLTKLQGEMILICIISNLYYMLSYNLKHTYCYYRLFLNWQSNLPWNYTIGEGYAAKNIRFRKIYRLEVLNPETSRLGRSSLKAENSWTRSRVFLVYPMTEGKFYLSVGRSWTALAPLSRTTWYSDMTEQSPGRFWASSWQKASISVSVDIFLTALAPMSEVEPWHAWVNRNLLCKIYIF